jgi:hypothetical protein
VWFFTNTFIWTIDPRNLGEGPKPLFLYPVQIEKILIPLEEAIVAGEDRWWEKSRGVGFTWVFLSWAFHGWCFRPHWQGLLGSYEEALVDDRTAFSHFGKLDFLMRKLPKWFMDEVVPGFNHKQHRHKLKLVNPNARVPELSGNILQGDSASVNFGRGGRFLWVWFDEAASWMNLAASMSAASMTGGSRFGGSTPKGMNYWGKWVNNPEVRRWLLRIHWSEIPGQDRDWYEKQCAKLIDPVLIAQELDISYTGSVEGRVYPAWDRATFGTYDYEPQWPLYVAWDFGLDAVAIIWAQRDPVTGKVRLLDCYQNSQKSIDFYVPFVKGKLGDQASSHEYTADDLEKIEAHAKWNNTGIHFGDPTGTNRSVAGGKSPIEILRDLGIHVYTNDAARRFQSRKMFADVLLNNLEVNVPDTYGPIGCWLLDEAMRNTRYPSRNPDAQRTLTYSLPVHDKYRHLSTAFEYLAANIPPFRGSSRPKVEKRRRAYDRLIR